MLSVCKCVLGPLITQEIDLLYGIRIYMCVSPCVEYRQSLAEDVVLFIPTRSSRDIFAVKGKTS